MTDSPAYVRMWLRELSSQSKRFSVIFTHIGFAHGPVRRHIQELPATHLSVTEYLSSDHPHPHQGNPGLVVLSDIELLARRGTPELGTLRAKVMEDLDCGNRFLLVSTLSKSCFPRIPGSSLLEDAKVLVGPMVPPGDRVDERGVAALPAYAPDNGVDQTSLIRGVLADVSADSLAALEYACWECSAGPRDSLDLLSASDLIDMRTAGLVEFSDGENRWVVTDAWRDFKIFLADAVSRLTAAPEAVAETYARLWEIERTIRKLVGAAAREKAGDHWRKSLFSGEEQLRICENARRDAHPEIRGIADLRDPLEWLTLPELLAMRASKGLGDLGVSAYFWPRVGTELVPIRNRVAHSRLPRGADLETVRKWHKILVS